MTKLMVIKVMKINQIKKEDEKVDDYQLTRAFDLILAINLIKKPLN